MWAHYANNHIGFRIDFTLDTKKHDVKYGRKPEPIENIENLPKNSEIIEILTRKDNIWGV